MNKMNLPVPVDHIIEHPEPTEIFGEVVMVPSGARGQKPKSNGFQTQTTPQTGQSIRLEQ